MEYKDSIAIVTGGSRGIGRVIAETLAQAGMRITVCGRTQESLDQAAAELTARAGADNVLAVRADVTQAADVERMVQETVQRWGRVDVLINNAAVGGRGLFEEISEAEWDRVVDGTLKSVYLCCHAVLPVMKRQQRGYIINIGSWAGKEGMAGLGSYCAAKFGVVGLTQTLQQEGKDHHIRASVILPGATARQPNSGESDRLQPEDIAKTVLYLLSLSDLAVVPEIGVIRRTSL